MNPEIPLELETALLELLKSGQSHKEYDLLKALTQQGFKGFAPSLDELTLFRSHFLFFHILYRLQAKWLAEERGFLSIFSLEIKLHPNTSNDKALQEEDSLRDYYLDYQQFLTTQKEDVLKLINQFWEAFEQSVPENKIQQAKHCLNYTIETLTATDIQKHYRKLAQIHHPDKGGNAKKFQTLTEARDTLLKACNTSHRYQ